MQLGEAKVKLPDVRIKKLTHSIYWGFILFFFFIDSIFVVLWHLTVKRLLHTTLFCHTKTFFPLLVYKTLVPLYPKLLFQLSTGDSNHKNIIPEERATSNPFYKLLLIGTKLSTKSTRVASEMSTTFSVKGPSSPPEDPMCYGDIPTYCFVPSG